jgi:hypothetical protein
VSKPRSRRTIADLSRLAALFGGALLCLAPSRAPAALLYAISGDGASPASMLYTLDPSTGMPTARATLGNGDDGEGIAFRPDDGTLYHVSGTSDGLEFLESVNPDTGAVGPNLEPGATYGPSPATEIFAIAWYRPLGVFLASDRNFGFYHVTPTGQFSQVGSSGIRMRGFAVVGSRVYGVDPIGAQLFEIDPADGAVLATLPLTVDGMATSGNGLATHPETGVVYAIVKDPANPSGGRLLATLDVTTGQATSIANTGVKLAGISFRTHAPLYAISGDGASPSSTLYTLDPSTGTPSFQATLGNGDDGEAIAYHSQDGLLYHASGVSDGMEYLERIDPGTWTVGPNLEPGSTYGPDPATEITAIAWYPPLGVFLASDIGFDFHHVTPSGQFTRVGNSGLQMRGFAVVGSQVFGVDPFGHHLFEVDPSDGSVLATLPLEVDGLGTSGNGLATSPDTGVVFAILKNPLAPSGGRLLATLDVTTGQATSIGDTGLKLAGISFGRLAAPPGGAPVPALGPLGLATLPALLAAAAAWRLCGRRGTGRPSRRAAREAGTCPTE